MKVMVSILDATPPANTMIDDDESPTVVVVDYHHYCYRNFHFRIDCDYDCSFDSSCCTVGTRTSIDAMVVVEQCYNTFPHHYSQHAKKETLVRVAVGCVPALRVVSVVVVGCSLFGWEFAMGFEWEFGSGGEKGWKC